MWELPAIQINIWWRIYSCLFVMHFKDIFSKIWGFVLNEIFYCIYSSWSYLSNRLITYRWDAFSYWIFVSMRWFKYPFIVFCIQFPYTKIGHFCMEQFTVWKDQMDQMRRCLEKISFHFSKEHALLPKRKKSWLKFLVSKLKFLQMTINSEKFWKLQRRAILP